MINISKYCEAELYAQVRKRKKYTGMAEAEAKVKAVMGREEWAKIRVLNGGMGGSPLKKNPKKCRRPPDKKFSLPTNNFFSFSPHLKCARGNFFLQFQPQILAFSPVAHGFFRNPRARLTTCALITMGFYTLYNVYNAYFFEN